MDAVKFIEERNRMCGTMSEMWGVDAAQIVKNTEEWSAAHPRKTRQSVFLEQWPDTQLDKKGNDFGGVDYGFGMKNIKELINSIPAADVTPVVHGVWVCVNKIDPISGYRCSKCRRRVGFDLTPYCPNCGAKMDGGDNDEAD